MLQNRLYVGEIAHRGEIHAGEHAPIVERDLFELVQATLAGNRRSHAARPVRAASCPLTGVLHDAEGVPMSPSFGYGRGKRIYRYYVSASVLPRRGYIREMHDRYGAPGFLAAYNAGPGRYEAYLKEGRVLPAETRHYVAKIAPALDGSQRPASISVAPDPYAWTRASLFAPRSTSAPPDAVAAPSARVPVTSQASLGGLFIAVSSRSAQ